jgi:PHD/YefM family antitoxin component YafN of YafNO toxin-antitoxin module
MIINTMTSREFNQDASKAKRIAALGPVFITHRGKPEHVLLTVKEYEKITNQSASIVDLLAMPDSAEFDFEAPHLDSKLFHPAELL